jgi:hypothetical protein
VIPRARGALAIHGRESFAAAAGFLAPLASWHRPARCFAPEFAATAVATRLLSSGAEAYPMATTALTFPHVTDHEVQLAEVTALPATGTTNRLLHVLFRATVLAVAVTFWITGFIVLSSPLAVPFTVTMWICAAATMVFGIKADLYAERPAAGD